MDGSRNGTQAGGADAGERHGPGTGSGSSAAPGFRASGPGIAQRLALSFSALVLLFGLASAFALAGLLQIHDALHDVKHDGERMHTTLALAAAVHDADAQIAHAVIDAGDGGLGRYARASARLAALTDEARGRAATLEQRSLVDEIAREHRDVDALVQDRLGPALRAGDAAGARAAHRQTAALLAATQERADRLAAAAALSVDDFGTHTTGVQHATIRWTLVLLAAALALAVGVGVHLYRSIARPVAALAAGAARLAEGDLDTRVAVTRGDELGRLAAEMNAMTAALREHQERLVQSEMLAGVGRLAAGVAHEINNPLGVILGYVKLLRRNAGAALDADLKIVEDEAERCREVVEDLLDLTRAPAAEAEPVDVRALCLEVVERLRTAAPGPAARVDVDGAGAVSGSPRRLRQVVMNLVKNACDAAGPGGEVRLAIAPGAGGTLVLTVADSGPGVADDARRRLFEPFFTTKPTGTGMGLAVSRAIARAHGGDLDLAPAGTAGGAVFHLTLPAAEAAA